MGWLVAAFVPGLPWLSRPRENLILVDVIVAFRNEKTEDALEVVSIEYLRYLRSAAKSREVR